MQRSRTIYSWYTEWVNSTISRCSNSKCPDFQSWALAQTSNTLYHTTHIFLNRVTILTLWTHGKIHCCFPWKHTQFWLFMPDHISFHAYCIMSLIYCMFDVLWHKGCFICYSYTKCIWMAVQKFVNAILPPKEVQSGNVNVPGHVKRARLKLQTYDQTQSDESIPK